MEDPNRMAFAVINAARRWLQTRLELKRLLDSKSAKPETVQKAKRTYDKACTELEGLVAKFERLLKSQGNTTSMSRSAAARKFPWQNFFGMVAEVAKAAETAVGVPQGKRTPDVIDTEGETIK